MSLISVGELAEFIRLPTDTIDQSAAEAVLGGALELVRQEVGQSIDLVTDDVLVLPSPGGKLILLPELPVAAVTLVRWRWPGQDWTTLTEGTDYEVLLGHHGEIWRIGGSIVGLTSSFQGALGALDSSPGYGGSNEWPRAAGRGIGGFVEVTYTHGYEALPALLATVVKRVAARGYTNPEAVSQETTGRGNVTVYGQALGLYLSADDKRDLDKFRPGSRGGSR